MSTLISSVEHALAVAASDTVKVAKFVDTQVLPVLKKAQAEASTIEAVTSLVSPQLPISSAWDSRSSAWSSRPSTMPVLR